MEKLHGHTLEYWKNNAEEDYLKVPISVLKYITCLEEQIEQLTIPVISVSTLLEERKQWYLENEYKDYKDELPLFIQLKLDTDLRRDKSVFDWLYSRQR